MCEEPKLGDTFGRYKVTGLYFGKDGVTTLRFVDIECECGETRTRHPLWPLANGKVVSCGCWMRDNISRLTTERNITHGMSKTKLYSQWAAMLNRATNENGQDAKDYVLRGISVCDEWRTFETFRDWALSNGYEKGLELDRRNNDLSYSPENCRWTIHRVQCNNRRSNRMVTAFGETKNVEAWIQNPRCAVTYNCLSDRINKLGWDDYEKAITKPPRPIQKSPHP